MYDKEERLIHAQQPLTKENPDPGTANARAKYLWEQCNYADDLDIMKQAETVQLRAALKLLTNGGQEGASTAILITDDVSRHTRCEEIKECANEIGALSNVFKITDSMKKQISESSVLKYQFDQIVKGIKEQALSFEQCLEEEMVVQI